MKRALLLNVIVRERPAVFELLASKDKALLVWWNSFFVLNLRLDIVNSVRAFDLEGNGLPSQGLNEDLHATSETQDEMEGALLLNVVVRKSATILKLLSGEDEALLVRRNAFLVLDLGLDIINSIRGLDFESDGLPGQSLDENLHTTTETQDEMEGRLLLNIVIRESPSILELLSSEDQTLLVRGDTFLVLDFRLDVIDSVRGFDLKRDSLASKGLDKDLHDLGRKV